MKKKNVIKFIELIKDCENIEKVYIEEGIKEDYIAISYYDKDEKYKKKAKIYKRWNSFKQIKKLV